MEATDQPLTQRLAQLSPLGRRVLDALPQTQCTRCGYPDCTAYAQAVATDSAPINQCPPGGATGIAQLAAITGHPVVPLNPSYGVESPRTVAFIDEDWCIGCTLCIAACPTDAIIGTNKTMHTVQEIFCTGCELCLPVCPVDCILLEPAGDTPWSPTLAQQARERYAFKSTKSLHNKRSQAKTSEKPGKQALTAKTDVIADALARARARSVSPAPHVHPTALG